MIGNVEFVEAPGFTARVWDYLGVGDTAKALTEMEAAVQHREIIPQMIPFSDWLYDPVRHSARFAALMTKLGLDERVFTGATGGRPSR